MLREKGTCPELSPAKKTQAAQVEVMSTDIVAMEANHLLQKEEKDNYYSL